MTASTLTKKGRNRSSKEVSPVRRQQIAERLSQIPPKYRKIYERAVEGSKAAAIKAQCLECMGWSRSEVTRCTDMGCPLWTVRPFQEESEQP